MERLALLLILAWMCIVAWRIERRT